MKTKCPILIVDDDPRLRESLSDILKAKGYKPRAAATGKEAIDRVREEGPGLALIDLKLEDVSGLEVLREIKECSPDTECIMLTGFSSKASAIEAVNLGAYGYMQKPYDVEQLLLIVQRAIEKRAAEDALRVSEERYRTIFDQAADSIVLIDTETDNLVEFNERTHESLGYTRKEFEKLRISDVEVVESPEEVSKHMEKIIKVGTDRFETKHRTKSGEIRDIQVSSRAVSVQGKVFIQGIWRDITELRRSEDALIHANAQMEELLTASPTVIYRCKAEGNYPATFVGKNIKRLLGYEAQEFTDDPQFWADHIHPEDAPRVFAELSDFLGKGHHAHEYRLLHQDGTYRWMHDELRSMRDADGTPRDIIGNWLDITGRKQAEEEKNKLETQLRQAQKMEAIGTLAGGIAHDFNNILSAVIGYTELAMDDAPQGTSLRNNLQEVLKAGSRASDLVKQILAFSRQDEQELLPVRVKLIAKEALKLLRASLPSTIEIRQNLQSDGLVLADPTHIHQILMNLCTNAGHAMREKGGILEVSLTNGEWGMGNSCFESDQEQHAVAHLGLRPGPYVKLTVSDSGHGMAPEELERIFDPFFTTKGIGEGTGLGLAVVHGIVKNHGGKIRVYSEPGKGAAFHVYFPVIKGKATPEREIEGPLPTGNEHVLFIDDENTVADLGRQMLVPLGYEVTIRTSSVEALELFKARSDDFDIVVTDMTMPNMTGEALSREIMRIRPDIPVILCTGFSERITEESARAMGIRAFIMKPFVRNQLCLAIRGVLDE